MATTRLMGREPMPWQADVFETACEVDAFGQLWYREIVIVVPRQSGKTTLVIPWGVHRMTTWPERQFMVYTAQTRDKALKKLKQEQFYWINRSPFRRMLVPNRSGKIQLNLSHGSEHMEWINGSMWGIDAPTDESAHGDTLGLTVGDEIWSQKDSRLEAAFIPATATVDDSQSLWVSTVGKSQTASPFLWGKMLAGRSRVELVRMDRSFLGQHRTFYLELSAPDDADWMNPRTWWSVIPALGYTQTIAKIAAAADSMSANDGAEFRRGFLNQWRDDLVSDWKIPRDKWNEQRDLESEATDTIVWVVDVSPDRAWATISLAAERADGNFHIEVVDDGPGTDWIIDGDPTRELHGLQHLISTHGGALYYDHTTVGALAPSLREADLDAQPIPAEDIAVAAPTLTDYILNHKVWHLGQQRLETALASAVTSTFGDGWKWARGRSLKPITALVSVSLALRMLLKTLPDLKHDPLAALREGRNTP